jgi:catechol 2,3-dioxygenase-like lactoylglutathione lyase family enzyme
MQTLNHANLTTYDVPALRTFFEQIFGLRAVDSRGDKFSVMLDDKGFVLALMYDKHMTPEHGYPGYFHVGFLQDSRGSVDERYAAVAAAGYEAPAPVVLQRGGPPTYGFYCNAPGGVTVEVSTMNI